MWELSGYWRRSFDFVTLSRSGLQVVNKISETAWVRNALFTAESTESWSVSTYNRLARRRATRVKPFGFYTNHILLRTELAKAFLLVRKIGWQLSHNSARHAFVMWYVICRGLGLTRTSLSQWISFSGEDSPFCCWIGQDTDLATWETSGFWYRHGCGGNKLAVR